MTCGIKGIASWTIHLRRNSRGRGAEFRKPTSTIQLQRRTGNVESRGVPALCVTGRLGRGIVTICDERVRNERRGRFSPVARIKYGT